MKIGLTILQTGQARIRPSMMEQSADRSVFMRRLRSLTDRSWAEYIPIYTFLITHPEGHILFDTGESPRCNDWGYYPLWMPSFRLMCETKIEENQGIGTLLRERGIEPKDLKAVVISHLHHDHSGGLPDLVGAPVYLSQEHWSVFKNPIHATMEGAVPNRWPADFSPKMLQATGGPIGPFERSYPITSDGKVVAVDTPGHVPGHISLIVFGDDKTYFLAGDATYSQELLDREVTDGVNDDPHVAVETVRRIKEFARGRDVILLPAHDELNIRRLKEGEVYVPTKMEMR